MTKIYPSLLSVDFLNLEAELRALEEAGVDGLHFDVMDGRFVPNISIGIPVLDAVRKATTLPIDVHMMIVEPEKYIDLFAEHGADMISVHAEATPHIHRAIQQIQSHGVKAGVVINPGTPVSTIEPVLPFVDYVLVMTVNPGFGGQAFIDNCVAKVQRLSQIKDASGYHFEIEVDGGVNDKTAHICTENGASMLVTGSYFFKQENYAHVTQLLKD